MKADQVFRYACGFNILEITPSASTFSRFLTKLSRTSALERDFEVLIIRTKELGIVDGTNVSMDSTKIDAYEKSKPNAKLKNDGASANWGAKEIPMETRCAGLVTSSTYWSIGIVNYH